MLISEISDLQQVIGLSKRGGSMKGHMAALSMGAEVAVAAVAGEDDECVVRSYEVTSAGGCLFNEIAF